MSLKSKSELLEVVRPRYLKANKAESKKSWTSLRLPPDIIGNMRSEFSKTKCKFKTTLKGKPKPIKPSMLARCADPGANLGDLWADLL